MASIIVVSLTLAASSAGGKAQAQASPETAVVAWGYNGLGELGNGTATATDSAPEPVESLSGIEAVSSGGAHSLALLENGSVAAWGWNTWGQLGIGTTIGPETCLSQACSTNPVAVTFAPPLETGVTVTAVSAGAEDSLVLLSDGTVMAWGDNADGELGDGSNTGPGTCVYDSQTYGCSPTPVLVEGLSDVTSISAGQAGSLALLANGTVMAWGNGVDTPTEVTWSPHLPAGVTITAISEGNGDAFALRSDGILMAWGNNSAGQLGKGDLKAFVKPVKVTKLTEVTAVSASANHALALLSNGTVWAWGSDIDEDLGTHSPNASCQCLNHPVKVKHLSQVAAISAGPTHNLVLLLNGTVRGWGEGSDGQLGSSVTSMSAVPHPIAGLSGRFTDVYAGDNFSLARS